MILPIWKPIEIDATEGLEDGKVPFSVKVNGSTVYQGEAYEDADSECYIQVNDLLVGRLGNKDLYPYEGIRTTGILVPVVVTWGENDDYEEEFKVINDWSWDNTRDYGQANFPMMNAPVMPNRADYRYLLPIDIYHQGGGQYRITYKNTAGETVKTLTQSTTSDVMSYWLAPTVPGTVTVMLNNLHLIYSGSFGEYCDAGVLIYRNAFGGFDQLPLAGVVEREAYTRDEEVARRFHGSIYVPSRLIYGEKVTKTYTLRTHALTDEQAARMHHALGTMQAWLRTPETGAYIAVNVKAGEWKRKTFKNEGRQRVVYEFPVKVAHNITRR